MYSRFGSRRDIEQMVEQIGEQIGSFIDQVSNQVKSARETKETPSAGHQADEFSPRIDIEEDDASVYVSAELPGMDKSEIRVTVSEERVLTIRGEKKRAERAGTTRRMLGERVYGLFSRSIALPDQVDPKNVRAEFSNGLLTLTIGKSAENDNEIKIEIQ